MRRSTAAVVSCILFVAGMSGCATSRSAMSEDERIYADAIEKLPAQPKAATPPVSDQTQRIGSASDAKFRPGRN